ncbi:DUF4396 domain-containing protein [Planctomycetota bacterium]|nr:DUF4396 domain-containing protein [Planctomycetota bacterium]
MNPGDLFLLFWLIISALISVWVYNDLPRRSPALRLMKPAWILICIYTGIFGLLVYELTCKSSKPLIEHSRRFRASNFRKASASTVHCVTGASTGIIIAATIASILGMPTWLEFILEYILSFAFAILLFHGLYHANTYNSYVRAINKTILSEWISLNFVLAAIFPVISVCFTVIPEADHPTLIRFWFVMQLSAIVGFLAGFPMIHWLVDHNLKPLLLYPPKDRINHPYTRQKKSTTHSHPPASAIGSHCRISHTPELLIAALISLFLLAAGLTIAIYLTPKLPMLDFGDSFPMNNEYADDLP